MYDIIIKNGTIVDGTGNPWYKANIAIQGEKIVKISRADLGEAKKVIDAKGLVVSPGFCDLHTHTDMSILYHQKALSSIHQGVTTEGVGQCGTGAYCFAEGYEGNMVEELIPYAATTPDNIRIDWHTLGEFREKVQTNGLGINLAPYIPSGTVRQSVMGVESKGGERFEPTAEEMQKMKDMVRQGMLDGAFGISTGLRYPWGRNTFTEETIELTKIVAEFNGIYISHMRSESDTLIESVQELIKICEEAGTPGCLSHHKAIFPENWGKVNETTRLVDKARARGTELNIDFYPWTHAAEGNLGGAFLGYLIEPEMSMPEIMQMLEDLPAVVRDDQKWEKVKEKAIAAVEKDEAANLERTKVLAERGIKAPALWHPATFNYIVYSRTYPHLEGKNLAEAAKILKIENFWDAARKIYLDDEGSTLTAAGIMCEEDIITILKNPVSSISTDGAAYDILPDTTSPLAWCHPRNFGTFAKVLQRYVREMKLLSLEEAVRKMTSLPLRFLGIQDRGLIQEGFYADITIFDAQKITNLATYANPAVYPQGIFYVLVNGQVALDNGKETGSLSGKVLSRN